MGGCHAVMTNGHAMTNRCRKRTCAAPSAWTSCSAQWVGEAILISILIWNVALFARVLIPRVLPWPLEAPPCMLQEMPHAPSPVAQPQLTILLQPPHPPPPSGLTCGHKFCRGCALAACGYGRTVGTLSNVCSYIPRRTRCPQCRQAGVYQGAVVLKEVGRLIEDRWARQSHPSWLGGRAFRGTSGVVLLHTGQVGWV